jgi:pectate disaccharide-lyase
MISKTALLTFVAGLALLPTSQATLYFEDHFPWSTGNLGTVGSSGGWSGSNSGVTVTTNSLDATLLGLLAATGNKVTTTTSSSSGTYNQFNSGIITGDVYCSFLLRVNSTTGLDGTGKVIVGLIRNGSSSSYYVDAWLRLNGANVEIGLSKLRAGTTWRSAPLTVGTTYLVVVKYQFVANSNNDGVSLWVNPTALGGGEPGADVSFSTGSDGNNSTGIGRCYLYGGMTVDLDELRIGSTWADVAPSGGTTPAAPAGPCFTEVRLLPEAIVLRGTNGTASAAFAVLANADLALPAAQWPSIATNRFDASGRFDCTNPIVAGSAQQFFCLRVGGVVFVEAPAIVTQPQDRTVTNGQNATFTVAASGTAPLSYQWFRNNSTLVSGGTNATLTLTTVSTNDAGSYSATVSNAAGSATSSNALLTVVVPPPAPPTITAQPQSQTAVEGQTVSFTVAAGGTAPLSYQWYFNTNTPLADQTNTSLTLTGVTTNDAGVYSVLVTNSVGSTPSAFATLTVIPPSTNSATSQVVQAEDGTFTGIVDTSHSGYTGTGFVDTDNAVGAYVEIEFGEQSAGSELLLIRYAHGKTDDRSAELRVNGAVVNAAIAFPPTGSFTTWLTVSNTIPVQTGRNVVRLTALNSAGLVNLDRFEITGAPQFRLKVTLSGRGSVNLSPSDPYGYFNPGTSVTLTAEPYTNASFVGWSGALSGTNNPQTLLVNTNLSVIATFQNEQVFNLYVSPTGNDANPGTIEAPFYSLHTAVAAAFPGDVIYLRGGTYYYTNTVFLAANANSNNPITITAYPGEQPVLDWSLWTPANETIRGGARGLKVTGSYWHLKGFTISYAPDNGVKCEGHHITFEQMTFHHNGDGGLQIGLNKEDYSANPDPDHLAAYVYVLNCDAYRNADPATDYENADGFSCKLYAGRGNRFYGCRAWENCDDGWDCYQTEYEIVIERCWAWHNGDPAQWGFSSFNGDGNGFKLGGDNTYCPMTVLNCVALDCQYGTTVGFAFNNNTAPITLYNCSALNCGRPYKFGEDGNVFKNCLDWNSTRPAPIDITGTSTQVNNSWNLPVTVTAADFVSVSASDAVAPRQADGSLPDNGFARLAAGSDLIDQGVDVGLPYNGTAPDLGAYEYSP